MNVHFSLFVQEFGKGIRQEKVPDDFLTKYKGILPNGLLEFWQEEGWCSYADGLFWTVNPENYSWLVDGWVRNLPELPAADYYIFARNAFGEFYCLSTDSEKVLTISCPRALIIASKEILNAKKNPDLAVQGFFATADKEQFDFLDEDDIPLFPLALEKLGPVSANEVYGFTPLLPVGGSAKIENLSRLRMDVHIDIVKQFVNPALELF